MSDEYTPTIDDLVDGYAYCTGIGPVIGERRRAIAKRAIAAHDRALREQIAREVRADMFRGVRAWVERFSPGDRWDPQDAIDLESALLGIVEANPDRSHARGEGSE